MTFYDAPDRHDISFFLGLARDPRHPPTIHEPVKFADVNPPYHRKTSRTLRSR